MRTSGLSNFAEDWRGILGGLPLNFTAALVEKKG